MKSAFLILISLLLFNCNSSYFSENQSINNNWNEKKPLIFKFNIDNDKVFYDINIVVRNNNSYPFRNIYFFTELNAKRDTVQYELAEKDGTWKGTGITETKETFFSYKTKYLFPKKGKNTLKIYQGMRKENLIGIEDISLVINKSK